jgi:hypothetical protein
VLAGLVREETVTRLDLPPFARDELALLLAAILGEAPDRQLLDALFERSEGNAFFAEQLLAAGGEVARLPELLRDVLLVPLDVCRLRREVLQVVAAAGGQLGHDLLAVVAGLAEPELDAASEGRSSVGSCWRTRRRHVPLPSCAADRGDRHDAVAG